MNLDGKSGDDGGVVTRSVVGVNSSLHRLYPFPTPVLSLQVRLSRNTYVYAYLHVPSSLIRFHRFSPLVLFFRNYHEGEFTK